MIHTQRVAFNSQLEIKEWKYSCAIHQNVFLFQYSNYYWVIGVMCAVRASEPGRVGGSWPRAAAGVEETRQSNTRSPAHQRYGQWAAHEPTGGVCIFRSTVLSFIGLKLRCFHFYHLGSRGCGAFITYKSCLPSGCSNALCKIFVPQFDVVSSVNNFYFTLPYFGAQSEKIKSELSILCISYFLMLTST